MTTVNRKQIKEFESDLLDYINKHAGLLPRRPQGFGITALEYAELNNVGESVATRTLKKMVHDGKLIYTVMSYGGRKTNVFHRKGEK